MGFLRNRFQTGRKLPGWPVMNTVLFELLKTEARLRVLLRGLRS